jgi:cysteine desulfurase
MSYFDYNATTPLDERVLEAMLPFLSTFYGNPSSLYRQGRLARSALDNAREQVSTLVDAPASQIIFTSGGTEANNLALATLTTHNSLAISTTEHPSITESAISLQKQNITLSHINVDRHGLITQSKLDQLIVDKPDLVSIMLANNETGVIQDLETIAQQLRANGVKIHTDAVQALGKIPVSFKQLAVHFMSISSHKIYGPKGCGALIYEKGLKINPIIIGGGQERELRAGTENVAAIVGFGKAAELAKAELSDRNAHLLTLRNQLEIELHTIPNIHIFAEDSERLPNTVLFGMPEVDGEMLLMKLDQIGYAVSSGSACASGGKEPSPVLIAMGVEPTLAKSAIRISLGLGNTQKEISNFIQRLKPLVYQA